MLFENHGDMTLNSRIMQRLGYLRQYKEAIKTVFEFPYSYLVLNLSAKLPNKIMRVASNIFSENSKYVEFFAYHS